MIKKHFRNFLLLSTITTISVYGINKAISLSSSMGNLLKTDHGNFFDWKYGKIFYTKQGKGSPVLLIHDLNPASSSYEWHRIVNHLAKSYTVYTIDLLGCGRSDKPNITYSNYLYVQLLTDFIRTMIKSKPDVVATGDSSSFTVMACNMEPDLFNKILIINPNHLAEFCKTPSKRKNALKFFIDSPIFGTMIYNLAFTKRSIEKTFYNDYYYESHFVPTRVLDSYYEAAHAGNGNGKYLLSSIKSHYTNINIVHALKNINNSIYLIESKERPERDAIIHSYVSYNPSIEASCVEDSKYLPQLEAPDKLLDVLNLYLKPM